MNRRTSLALMMGLTTAMAGTALPAFAQDFPSQEVRIIVPYGPGGGFDTAARMIAPYLEQYLGDGASVIVENLPGGGGNTGLSQLQRAAPDGHTIAILNLPGHMGPQVAEMANYDLFELDYIGNITSTNYVTTLSSNSQFKTIEDLQNADRVIVGSDGLEAVDLFSTMDALEIEYTPIIHDGSNDAILASIRGDVDIIQFTFSTLYSYMQDGDLVPIILHADQRHPDFPDVPTIAELGHPEVLALSRGARVLAAPPGTDEAALEALRSAFEQAVADPDYIAQTVEANIDSMPTSHETIPAMVEGAFGALMPFKDLLQGN
ncbi:Bug family tripartite tricarboxylate transporter substrate binding protein [Pelagibacterium halotolerans]|uniref:Tricarboxylate transport protein TctC n=1 Tax=Pelagibacterium halotolerans (strain DSM 22347 / JCM 15775 / CGMCC 1.7692 / B2) TaxID=1082931 RepID=G4RAM9_PELHB|nr:tripartite tricarboxylate transporter substrate binding protein [Pelagibacterium halotolerans]AEQ52552.1 hypothetical protein KKY_2544 [Pelagibacterium halotolerans B2]QJR17729.1 tripartite tricarboxylate transporter substrate binding protein [Pelagibacterium halotolerans]SEA39936.1 Tripartite-type tricarboxylate transporter, receptor component TctC [Pelagibacterium halotolerans]